MLIAAADEIVDSGSSVPWRRKILCWETLLRSSLYSSTINHTVHWLVRIPVGSSSNTVHWRVRVSVDGNQASGTNRAIEREDRLWMEVKDGAVQDRWSCHRPLRPTTGWP